MKEEFDNINKNLWKFLSEHPLCNDKNSCLSLDLRIFIFWEQCPVCRKNKEENKCPIATEIYKSLIGN